MKLLALFTAAVLSTSAIAKQLKFQTQDIKGQIKLLIDMDQLSDPIDIVFVVDNSASMTPHQQTVVRNTDQFMQALSAGGADWRLALISTSQGERPYIGMAPGDELTMATPDAVKKFADAVGRLGNNGEVNEAPFASLDIQLRAYPGFLRPQAKLAIIVITDASEQSTISTSDLSNHLIAMKGGDASKISFYGFLNPSEWCPATDDQFTYAGSKYEEILKTISGEAKSLCAPDFGANISKLGTKLNEKSRTKGTISQITLPSIPQTSSIKVNYGTQIIERGVLQTGWIFDATANQVLLGGQIQWTTQPLGTPLEITYTPKDWVK